MPEPVVYEISLRDILSGQIAETEGHVEHFEHTFTGALGKIQESIESVTRRFIEYRALEGVWDFVKDGVDEYKKLREAQAEVQAGLTSTHYAAGVNFGDITEDVEGFFNKVNYSKDALEDMESVILTFPGVTKKNFKEASQDVLDMSTRLHRGLDETAIMVGKALQDPEKGITALRRVGVNFNETQTKVIKKMVETGHAAQAQAAILHELGVEFAGSAEAAANVDPLFRFNKIIEELKEDIGSAAYTILNDFRPQLEELGTDLREGVGWVLQHKDAIEWWISTGGKLIVFYATYQAGIKAITIANGIWVAALGIGITKEGEVAAATTITNTAISEQQALLVGLATEWDAVTANIGRAIFSQTEYNELSAISAQAYSLPINIGGGLAAGTTGLATGVSGAIMPVFIAGMAAAVIASLLPEDSNGKGWDLKRLAGTGIATGIANGEMFQLGGSIAKIFGIDPIQDLVNEKFAKDNAPKGVPFINPVRGASWNALLNLGQQAHSEGTPNHFKGEKIEGGGEHKKEATKIQGQKILHIDIKIDSLVKNFEVKTTTLTAGAAKVKEIITEVLLGATRDAQIAAGE